jgi:hypothetical protein
MLAEGAASLLHVCEFILILEEKLAAFVAIGDRNVGYHIFVVLFGPLWTKLGIVNNKNLLVPHALQNALVHFYGSVLIRINLRLKPLKHTISKQIVLKVVILCSKLH